MSQRSSGRSSRSVRGSQRSVDDNDISSSGETSSGAGRGKLSQSGLSAAQIKSLTSDVVSYILTLSTKNLPIRRDAIVKNVLKDMSKCFPDILVAAKRQLNKAFGFDLVEIPNQKNQYLLINKYSIEGDQTHIVSSDYEQSTNGLLLYVLCIIFMNGNSIVDKELWQALSKLGLYEDKDHDVFGKVDKLINKTFVKQLYLVCKPVPNTQPQSYEFTWGPRANAEISKMDVLEFACQIYGSIKPEQFNAQYKEAEEELREKTE